MKWPREYPPRPIVAVGVVIWQQDKVLLVRRNKPPRNGAWSIPGGAQKVGETVFEAAKREVMEETSLTIQILGLIDVVDSIRRDNDDRVQYHYTLVDVVAEWLSGTPDAQTDVSDAAWFDAASVPALGMWSETNRIIEISAQIRQGYSKLC
ncbi:MAG: NUDIX hydrolase [Rhodospirillales bacterium]|jgi:8-oxo-dGTP diphosphatase